MKKIIHISISLLLILATTGVSMSKHYCMDRLMDVKLSAESKICCPFMETEDAGCCENEVVEFVIDHEFQKIDTQSIDETKWNLIAETIFSDFASSFKIDNDSHIFPFSNAPPLTQVDLFILNCSYLL